MPSNPVRPATHGPRTPLLDDQELFARIVSRAQLQAGWAKVWTNAGAAGGDNVSAHVFATEAWAHLEQLHHALRKGRYRPGPVRIVHIPKKSGPNNPAGEMRKLSIPCVVDRIVQTAASQILTPLFDEEFEPASFGYRPGRSVKQAVATIERAHGDGFDWVVDADIENYFDTIAHDRLMERWGESVSPGPLSELVWSWLTHAAPKGYGVAQGSPLSPLLANLYLDRLDEAFSKHAFRLVRFADDFVILCRTKGGAEGAMKQAETLLAERGLSLNRDKSRVLDFDRGFKFLGHLFVRSMAMKVAPEKLEASAVGRLMRDIAQADSATQADALLEQAEEERKQSLGYAPGLRNLYIMQQDRRLSIRNQAFVVEQGHGYRPNHGDTDNTLTWRELIAIPHQEIDRIDLGPGVTVTDDALRHALATNTMVAYVNGHGETLGWSAATPAPRAGRHLAQAKLMLNDESRMALARIFVDARLRNQRAVLRRLLGGRKKEDKPQAVLDALVSLNTLIGRGESSRLDRADSISQLTGYEGQAAAQWWKAISALVHADFEFAGKRRVEVPARANICLNFLSWLLNRDMTVALNRAGLYPGFGVLHAVSDRRDACVYDLMEEFRAHLIGGLFVYCTNRRLIRPDMFSLLKGDLRLKPDGASALIRAYETRANSKVKSPRSKKRVSWRRLMVEQAFALGAHAEEGRAYTPYLMDY